MLEYAKTVLKKVSFSKELFNKEFSKFLRWLQPNEKQKLYEWCKVNYKENCQELLKNKY